MGNGSWSFRGTRRAGRRYTFGFRSGHTAFLAVRVQGISVTDEDICMGFLEPCSQMRLLQLVDSFAQRDGRTGREATGRAVRLRAIRLQRPGDQPICYDAACLPEMMGTAARFVRQFGPAQRLHAVSVASSIGEPCSSAYPIPQLLEIPLELPPNKDCNKSTRTSGVSQAGRDTVGSALRVRGCFHMIVSGLLRERVSVMDKDREMARWIVLALLFVYPALRLITSIYIVSVHHESCSPPWLEAAFSKCSQSTSSCHILPACIACSRRLGSLLARASLISEPGST